jgi:hypothetical protein
MNTFERGTEGQEVTPKEVAFSAADIDLVEVAKRTRGHVFFDSEGQPRVTWGEHHAPSLEWIDANSGLTKIEGEKTLNFWRGQWGGPLMETCGLVMGEDFVAFVHPRDLNAPKEGNDYVTAEIISDGRIDQIEVPVGVFNPVFLKAREIADKNSEAYLIKHPQLQESS